MSRVDDITEQIVKECADFGLIFDEDNQPPDKANEMEWMTHIVKTILRNVPELQEPT